MLFFGQEISLWILWFSFAGILLMIELLAPGIFAVFFAVAGFLAGIISLITNDFMVQFIVFILASFFGVIFGKRLVERIFKVNQEVKPSTIDALKGKAGIVVEPVYEQDNGLVKIEGEVWTAKTNSHSSFIKGEKVMISGIEGVTVLIDKWKGEE